MGLPVIDIDFKKLGETIVARSQRGVVALILKDTAIEKLPVFSKTDIPSSLSDNNKQIVRETLIGAEKTPNKILLYVIPEGGELADALKWFESQEFNIMTMPGADELEKSAIVDFIDKMREVVNYKCQAILKDKRANKEGIINFTAKEITVSGGETKLDYTHRIAGLIAGTPLSQSITFSVIPEIEDIETLTKEDASARIEAGELVLIKEMGKVRIARGINSLVTLDDEFDKIKLVSISDLIHNDIRRVAVEKYLGKIANTYMNKCVLMTDIKTYLNEMAKEELIENVITVELDLEAQKKYLKDIMNVNIENLSDREIKEHNTKDKVFIVIKIKLIDAIEDIFVNVML